MEILPELVFNQEGLSPQPRGIWILNAMTAMAQLSLLLTLRSVAESLQVT